MSLKAIHICFVTLFTVLCFGLSAFTGRTWMREGGGMNLFLSVLGGCSGVLMLVYFRMVLRKLKDVSML
jgi:TRAP-type mannitol/chloroaromatic compound transport system substrate-binding protein